MTALVLGAAMLLGGFVTIAAGAVQAGGTDDVQTQVALLVSGGLGGIALTIAGAAVVAVALGRQDAADERAAFEDLLDAATSSRWEPREHDTGAR